MNKTLCSVIVLQLFLLFGLMDVQRSDSAEIQSARIASNEYQATLETFPATPNANQSFQVIVKGEFPSANYAIKSGSIAILESYPEQIHVHLEIEMEPEAPSSNHPVSFEYLVGVLKFDAAERQMRGFINEVQFYEGILSIQGEDSATDPRPFLMFDRSGGIAGISQRLFLDGNGHFLIEGTPPFSVAIPFGSVQRTMFLQIVDQVFAIDFSTLQKQYESPTPIADGFYHAIQFDGVTVGIEAEATLPDELNALYVSLLKIMDGEFIQPPESASSVNGWEMY